MVSSPIGCNLGRMLSLGMRMRLRSGVRRAFVVVRIVRLVGGRSKRAPQSQKSAASFWCDWTETWLYSLIKILSL